MNDQINYKSNPLHGVSLKTILTEIISQYGFEILYAYLNINCFRTNPSVESSVKFLKKTDWAREKVEAFYLYQYKNLPAAAADQMEIPPRDRIFTADPQHAEPADLSLEDAERLQEMRAKRTSKRTQDLPYRSGAEGKNAGSQGDLYAKKPSSEAAGKVDQDSPKRDGKGQAINPWANCKK